MSRRGSCQTASGCTQSTACVWWRTCVRFSPAPAPLPLHATSSCWGKVTPPSHHITCAAIPGASKLQQTQRDFNQSVCGGSTDILVIAHFKIKCWTFVPDLKFCNKCGQRSVQSAIKSCHAYWHEACTVTGLPFQSYMCSVNFYRLCTGGTFSLKKSPNHKHSSFGGHEYPQWVSWKSRH